MLAAVRLPSCSSPCAISNLLCTNLLCICTAACSGAADLVKGYSSHCSCIAWRCLQTRHFASGVWCPDKTACR